MKDDSLITFIAGAAVGALLGILLAPEKGEVTRRKLRETADDRLSLEPVRERVRKKLDDIEEKLSAGISEDEAADGEEKPEGRPIDIS